MNIGTKLLKKIQTKFKSTSKRSYTVIKSVSIQGCKDGSTYTNQ
jgi:hypothetical protein